LDLETIITCPLGAEICSIAEKIKRLQEEN